MSYFAKQTNILLWILIISLVLFIAITLLSSGASSELLFKFTVNAGCASNFCAW